MYNKGNYMPNDNGLKAQSEDGEVDMFLTSFQPIRAGIYNSYIFGAIRSPIQFIPTIEILENVSENDIVVIHLQSPGGSVDATDTLLTAMRNCEARIIVKATGGVHSAGSVILLAADEFTLSENFNCLIHCGSLGSGGTFAEWRAESKHKDKLVEKFMRSTYRGFLTDEEIDKLLDGKDFWCDGDEFVERFEKRNEFMRKEIAKSQEDMLEMLDSVSEGMAKSTKKRSSKKKSVPDEV